MSLIDCRGQPLPKDHSFRGTRIIFGAKRPTIHKDSIEPEDDELYEPVDALTLEMVEAAMNSKRPMREILTDDFLRSVIDHLKENPPSDN